jgi:hypothetical protein
LTVILGGTSVAALVNGAPVATLSFKAPVADGAMGALSRTGTTSFDDLRLMIGRPVNNSVDPHSPVRRAGRSGRARE